MTAEHQATVLWTWQQLVDALFFADADGAPNRPLTGVSIDTRSLQPGGATRPTLGFSSTRFPRTGNSSTDSKARRQLA